MVCWVTLLRAPVNELIIQVIGPGVPAAHLGLERLGPPPQGFVFGDSGGWTNLFIWSIEGNDKLI